MLLRFQFSNYRSFRDRQELSLVASSLSDLPNAAVAVPGMKDRALLASGLYGANASGKTTVLRALREMCEAVRESHRLWEPDQPISIDTFRGSNGTQAEFVVDFTLTNVRYQYGFAATKKQIEKEWLFRYLSGKKQVLYSREAVGGIRFGRNLPGDNKIIEGLTRTNSLFLSSAAQNNHEALLPVFKWFQVAVHFAFGERETLIDGTIRICARDDERRSIAQHLLIADLGIADVLYGLADLGPQEKEKRKNAAEAFIKLLEIKGNLRFNDPDQESFIKLVHRVGTELVPFDLGDESHGTIAYFSLLGPILRALKHGGVLVVDELDSSLHPLMARSIVKLFNDARTNPQSAQLIFNTHDTNLLARDLLRRDQIWFTEKDATGVSHLYPLTDFKPRPDENLQNGYLQGRYGAIPFLASDAVLADAGNDGQPQ